MRDECDSLRERMLDSVAGRTDLTESDRGHLAECDDCRAFGEELDSASAALERLPVLEENDDRITAVLDRVRSEGLLNPAQAEPTLDADDRLKLRVGARRFSLRWIKRFAVAACLLAMVGTLAYITAQAIREESSAIVHASEVRGEVTFTANGETESIRKLRNYPGGEIATDDTGRAKLVLKGDTRLEVDSRSMIVLSDNETDSPREVVLRSEFGRFWVECNGPVRFGTPYGWVEADGESRSKYIIELRPANPDQYVRWDRAREQVDLVFRNVPAPDAFAQISEIAELPISIVGDTANRTVTANFKGLMRNEMAGAIRTLTEVNGFDVEETENGLQVTPKAGFSPRQGVAEVTVFLFHGTVLMVDKGGEHRLTTGMKGQWSELSGGGAALRIEKCDDLITPMAWRGKLHNPGADGFQFDNDGNVRVYRHVPRIVTVCDFGQDESHYRATLVDGSGLEPGSVSSGFRLVGVNAAEGVAGFKKGDNHYVSYISD